MEDKKTIIVDEKEIDKKREFEDRKADIKDSANGKIELVD